MHRQRHDHTFWTAPSYMSFDLGRSALLFGLSLLRPRLEKRTVLVPDLICHEALVPFHQLEIETKTYPIGPDLEPDLDELERLIRTYDAVGLMNVHHFGFPSAAFEACLAIAQKNNIILIEDNAHGFGARWQGKLLGQFGDVAIHSPRKSYPLEEGGLLAINGSLSSEQLTCWRKRYNDLPQSHRPPPVLTEQWRSRIKSFAIQSPLGRQAMMKRRMRNFFQEQTADKKLQPLRMSQNTNDTLVDLYSEEHLDLRQEQNLIWQRWARGAGLFLPQATLKNEGSAPLCTPVLAHSQSARDQLLRTLFFHGIDAFPWPSGPQTNAIQARLLCLPVNPYVPIQNLEQLVEQLNDI